MRYTDEEMIDVAEKARRQQGSMPKIFNPWTDYAIRVIKLKAGQPRPYADSIYQSELHFYFPGPFGEGKPSADVVKRIASGLIRPFNLNGPENWAAARCTECIEIRPLVWRVTIVEPFTD